MNDMDDLISRKEAIEHLKNHLAEKIKELAEELLDQEPSAQSLLQPRWDELKYAPVVRCSECVYRGKDPKSQYWCVQWGSIIHYDNGYCYRGRKSEEE